MQERKDRRPHCLLSKERDTQLKKLPLDNKPTTSDQDHWHQQKNKGFNKG